jgi:transposase
MNQQKFDLDSKTIGVLPIVNHFLNRLKIRGLLEKYLPPSDERAKLAAEKALEVLLRNIILCRAPLYSVGEWAAQMVPSLLGLRPTQIELLNDDRVGRALDRLFEADRSAMLTELVVGMVRDFEIELEQFHNDSTTLTLHGEYLEADGHTERGNPTLVVIFGHNKDHRPDLKQLLWILTVSEDGAVPVHFKVADGNTQDSTTHIETWEVLRLLVGDPNFLYVADSKLCSRENLSHIHEAGGKFITVLPQSRKEDRLFKEWLSHHTPAWEEIARFPHPRRKDGPPDIVRAVKSPIPDADGYRLIWFHSSHKRERDAGSRQDRIIRACKKLDVLKAKLEGPRCRYSTLKGVELAVREILVNASADTWIRYQIQPWQKENYRQERRGRPGKDTRWRRRVKMCFRLSWEIEEEKVRQDALSDGIFPLLTNCKDLSFLAIYTAYKTKQPLVEKRHDLLKNTLEVTPAYLKSVSRLEAFLFMSYIAITVHALIERELRKAMERDELEALPLYPENRECRAPTMARLIEVFGNLQRHILSKAGEIVQRFNPQLSELQQQILDLLRLSPGLFSIDH